MQPAIWAEAYSVLQKRGYQITAIARDTSRNKIPPGCEVVVADVLNGESWARFARPDHTVVHLVGVPHPSPAKAKQFIDIDLRSQSRPFPWRNVHESCTLFTSAWRSLHQP